jgi:hypothetical protein
LFSGREQVQRAITIVCPLIGLAGYVRHGSWLQRLLSEQGASVHSFHQPVQDFPHYLGGVISGYQERFDFGMAFDFDGKGMEVG